MANIHGLNDNRGGNNNRNNGPARGGGGPGGAGPGADDLSSLLGINRDSNKDPRTETFFDMLHFSFCPTLKWASFTTVICIVNTLLFVLSISLCGIETSGDFLQVKTTSFFEKFAENSIKITKQHEYWRLISACLLHLGFSHIVMNTVALIIWGSFIENFMGLTKYMGIYFASGLAGNLLSACVNHSGVYSVGASGCIMGVTASLIGMVVLNWMAMSEGRFKEIRGQLTCMVVIIVIFTLLFTLTPTSKLAGTSKTDNWAHLGGFIGGMFLSMVIGKVYGRADGGYEKKVRLVGGACLGLYTVGTIIGLLTQ